MCVCADFFLSLSSVQRDKCEGVKVCAECMVTQNGFAPLPSPLSLMCWKKFFFYCNSSVCCALRSMYKSLSVEVQTNVRCFFFLHRHRHSHLLLCVFISFFNLSRVLRYRWSCYSLILTFGFLIESERKRKVPTKKKLLYGSMVELSDGKMQYITIHHLSFALKI